MIDISYDMAMIFLFVAGGLYFNRKRFNSMEHKVGGRYYPEYTISIGMSVFFGIFMWIVVKILLWSINY